MGGIRKLLGIKKRNKAVLESQELETLRFDLDILKSHQELGRDVLFEYLAAKETGEYWLPYDQPTPLITVCVATYNRAKLLTERALPSILEQTYKNIEVIVVGDGCTDDTEKRVNDLGDQRVRFVNLAERGQYPADAHRRWMVAGTSAVNHALSLAKGSFITHLDDDDRYELHRLESLLETAVSARAEMVWHPFYVENARGDWVENNADKYRLGYVTTSSVFYHAWLGRIGWNMDAHVFQEPGDWNRFRKFNYLGVKQVRSPEYLLWHYKERNQG